MFNNKFDSALPLKTSANYLKEISDEEQDDLVISAISSLSPSVLENGAPSVAALRTRFKVVHEEVHRATSAPSWSGVPIIIRQAMGEILHTYFYGSHSSTPKLLRKGKSNSILLDRVAYRLNKGQIEEALSEVRKMDGLPRLLIRDWEKALADRVCAEQTSLQEGQ